MNYLARCIPPTCLTPIATAFDETVVDTAYSKLDIAKYERTEETLRCLRTPLKLGGFGLTSVVESSPAAYIASLAALAVSTAQLPPLTTTSLLHSWIQSTLNALNDDFADLHAAAPHSQRGQAHTKLPATPDTFVSHFQANPQFPVKLQHSLVKQAAQLRFDAAVEGAREFGNNKQLAHYLAYSAPHAHKWKTVIPSRTAHTLSAPHYIVSARLNLRLRPYRTLLPDNCASCGVENAIKRDSWHHLELQRAQASGDQPPP